jgi:hypothetical protein
MGWTLHAPPNGTAAISFRVTASRPVTSVRLSVNGVVTTTMTGDDLRATLGLRFTAPSAPGVYALNVTAIDALGCRDATGLPRSITVP